MEFEIKDIEIPLENFDWSGHSSHHYNGNTWHKNIKLEKTFMEENGKIIMDDSKISSNIGMFDCDTCGVTMNYLPVEKITENLWKISEESKCLQTEPLVTTTIIEFPSGEVLVKDNIKGITDYVDVDTLEIPGEEYYGGVIYNSISKTPVQKFYMEKLAEHNIAHGMCGNSSPTLYSNSNGDLFIASVTYEDWLFDETTGKYDESLIKDANPDDYSPGVIDEVDRLNGEEKSLISDWKTECMIVTDLWAYTLVDLKVYEELVGKKFTPEDSYFPGEIIKVKPGKYKFTHYTDNNYYDYEDNVKIFGSAEYIGE